MTLSIRLAIRRVKAAEDDVKRLITLSIIPVALIGAGSGLGFSPFVMTGITVMTGGFLTLLTNVHLIIKADKRLREAKKHLDELL